MNKEEINALHNKFSEYGRNAKHWIRQCQLMLPEIKEKEVWKLKGFSSIYEYAAKLAGMSKNSVDDALRILEKVEDKPALKKVIEEKGIHAVRPIITVATEKTAEFWAEKAMEMSKNTLETYVRDYKNQNEESCPRTGKIFMELDIEIIEKLKQIKGDRDWNALMKDLLGGKGGMYMTENGTVPVEAEKQPSVEVEEKPVPVNTGKRYISRKIQKYVTRKTSGLCAYPGCTKPYEILHHTERFAIDSIHDPDTLKPLCKAHERLAHKGLVENEETVPVNWSLLAEPDTRNPKYEVDKKVNEYYMPKLE